GVDQYRTELHENRRRRAFAAADPPRQPDRDHAASRAASPSRAVRELVGIFRMRCSVPRFIGSGEINRTALKGFAGRPQATGPRTGKTAERRFDLGLFDRWHQCRNRRLVNRMYTQRKVFSFTPFPGTQDEEQLAHDRCAQTMIQATPYIVRQELHLLHPCGVCDSNEEPAVFDAQGLRLRGEEITDELSPHVPARVLAQTLAEFQTIDEIVEHLAGARDASRCHASENRVSAGLWQSPLRPVFARAQARSGATRTLRGFCL